MNVDNYSQSPPWMASPTPNDDNNYYGSPALSPGSWNVPSPEEDEVSWNISSPQSHSGHSHGDSIPPITPSSVSTSTSASTQEFIGLPRNLGEPLNFSKSNGIPKTKHDVKRQKRSELKAQQLLSMSWVTEEPSSPKDDRMPPSPTSSHPDIDDNGYAVRQQAIMEYKEKKRLARIETYKNGEQTPRKVGPPRIITNVRKERLATSTRKKKVVAPEEDYETINDFKSVLDIEREQEAERHALYLLKKFGF